MKTKDRAPLFGKVELPNYPVIMRTEQPEDGTYTIYKIWPRRVESETFWVKAGPDQMTTFLEQNAALPKTKRKYETKGGKWVSYARARQLGLV